MPAPSFARCSTGSAGPRPPPRARARRSAAHARPVRLARTAPTSAREGPSFRNNFVANFMTNFSDAVRAEELAGFAPAQATSGGRIVVARSHETILINAELKARVLPAIGEWVRRRNGARD